MKNNKLVRLIISIIIAVGLWVYVISVVNPAATTVIRNVPVTLTGVEELKAKNLAIVGSGEYTVDVTVRASRTDLMVISEDNFYASADVSGVTMGQDYITVEIDAPNGYVVEDIKSRKIQVYVDELETKTVDVQVICSDAENSYETAVLSLYPETVEIYGAKQLVDNVGSYVVRVDSSKLTYESSTALTLPGEILDLSGNKMNGVFSSATEISAWASIYSTKTVSFKTNYYGEAWPGAVVGSINVPTNITIKGPSEILSSISEIESDWISIDGIFEDYKTEIVPLLPDGVQVAKKDEDMYFEVDIADNGKIEFQYYVGDVVVNNLSADMSVSCSLDSGYYITATITGPVSTLKTLSASDITISVDGSSFKSSTKSAKLGYGTQISGINVSLSPNTVNVDVRKY